MSTDCRSCLLHGRYIQISQLIPLLLTRIIRLNADWGEAVIKANQHIAKQQNKLTDEKLLRVMNLVYSGHRKNLPLYVYFYVLNLFKRRKRKRNGYYSCFSFQLIPCSTEYGRPFRTVWPISMT